MLKFNRWQLGTVILLVLAGIYFTLPNFFPEESTPPGLPESRMTLGLDLQGGSYLVLSVDTEGVLDDRVASLREEAREILRDAEGGRINFNRIRIDGRAIEIPLINVGDMDRAYDELRVLQRPSGTLTGGGIRPAQVSRGEGVIRIEMTEEAQTTYADQAVTDSIETVRRRIDALGTTEPQIQRAGPDRLVVQVPGATDTESLKNVINRTGQLSFHLVKGVAGPETRPSEGLILPLRTGMGQQLVLERTPTIRGDMVTDASATPDQDNGGYQINFRFDDSGARRFADFTRRNVGNQFAVVLDEVILTAPTIQEPIPGGSGRITGQFTPDEAAELSILIRSGALPAELTTIEQRTVGADLGADSVRAGTIALIIGFTGVVIFIVICYGRFGIYADLALIANVLFIFGALSLLGATLTLPGIAGIVLTIGMAVDANVLIFERIREEVANGKRPVVAVESGFRQAWSAILDANVTTFIAAFIMFLLGAGPVRGFAITLGIGVMTSVFTAFVITRIFAGGYVLSKRPKTLKI